MDIPSNWPWYKRWWWNTKILGLLLAAPFILTYLYLRETLVKTVVSDIDPLLFAPEDIMVDEDPANRPIPTSRTFYIKGYKSVNLKRFLTKNKIVRRWLPKQLYIRSALFLIHNGTDLKLFRAKLDMPVSEGEYSRYVLVEVAPGKTVSVGMTITYFPSINRILLVSDPNEGAFMGAEIELKQKQPSWFKNGEPSCIVSSQ